mgnify:CR=1 FL=1
MEAEERSSGYLKVDKSVGTKIIEISLLLLVNFLIGVCFIFAVKFALDKGPIEKPVDLLNWIVPILFIVSNGFWEVFRYLRGETKKS